MEKDRLCVGGLRVWWKNLRRQTVEMDDTVEMEDTRMDKRVEIGHKKNYTGRWR